MKKCWSPYASSVFGRCYAVSEGTIARIVEGGPPWQHFGQGPCSVGLEETVLNAQSSGYTRRNDRSNVFESYSGIQTSLAKKWRLAISTFSNFGPKYLDDDDQASNALG